MSMPSTLAAYAAVQLAGYQVVLEDSEPAIRCASEPLEFFSAPDWDSLAHYAMNYELCPCGRH